MLVGATLRNRYWILKPLGSGGFGDTYLAEDRDLPDYPQCVVKHLKPKDSDPRVLEVAQRLFAQEVKTLYQLGNQYEYIPKLFAHFEEKGEFYLVQEFIDGHDLSEELTLGNQLSEEKVIQLLQEILLALEGVHRSNIIHRDLKPQNIMRRRDGQLFLIDFGAVKEISALTIDPQGQTKLTIGIGTPGYLPKEQAGGKPKLSSDVYAVGMIGIEALTGIPPQALPEDPMTGEIVWRDRAPNVSAPLAELLSTMVRYHFSERYQSAIEARQALTKVVPPRVKPPRKLSRKLKQKIIAIVLGCTTLVASIFAAPQVIDYFTPPVSIESLIAVQPQFDDADRFSSELAGVKEGNSWSYIRKNGEKSIKNLKYEQGVNPYFSEGLARVKLNGKWGYVDQDGKFVIQPKFDSADDFSEGLAKVNVGGKSALPSNFDFDFVADSVTGGKWGYINKTGDFVVSPKFEIGKSFSEGLAAVNVDSIFGKKWGFIDKTGNLVIQAKFEDADSFSDGVAAVRADSSKRFTFIDTSGNLVDSLNFESDSSLPRLFFDEITLGFRDGLLPLKESKDGKVGYRSKAGKWTIQPRFYGDFYVYKHRFFDGLAAARMDKDGKWGYINKNGDIVIQMQFNDADSFSEGLAVVKKDNKCSYINTNGRSVIQPLDADKDGKCFIGSFSEGLAAVKLNGKWGYIRNPLKK